MSCPLTNAIFALVGILVGGLIGHWLAGVRDIAARKRKFREFICQWHSEVSNPKPLPAGYFNSHPSIAAYQIRISEFTGKVESVRDIFKNRDGFDALTKRLGNLKQEDWQNKPREVILEAIEKLMEIIK